MQRGLPRIRRCKSSRGSKSPSQSVCLVTQSRSTTPRSLATFFYSGLVNSFSFPLCTRSSATGPWDRAHGLSLASQYRSVCQCAVFSGLGGQPRLGCSCVPPSPPGSIWEWGEQWGKHWAQCLHHQHSGALCTLWSRITEPLSNRQQHKLWRECSGRYSGRTYVWVYVWVGAMICAIIKGISVFLGSSDVK